MQEISPLQYHHTSLTLRPSCRRRFDAALHILRRNGILWSESELLRQLAKMYLRHWRGRENKSATARRYNHVVPGEKYVRIAWYVDKVLYSILWQRAIHSGESISRIVDFAIRHYLPRLLEECLRSPMPGCARAARNAPYWQKRYLNRKRPQPDIFIIYQCKTEKNTDERLRYVQEYTIYRKDKLAAGDILELLRIAA